MRPVQDIVSTRSDEGARRLFAVRTFNGFGRIGFFMAGVARYVSGDDNIQPFWWDVRELRKLPNCRKP